MTMLAMAILVHFCGNVDHVDIDVVGDGDDGAASPPIAPPSPSPSPVQPGPRGGGAGAPGVGLLRMLSATSANANDAQCNANRINTNKPNGHGHGHGDGSLDGFSETHVHHEQAPPLVATMTNIGDTRAVLDDMDVIEVMDLDDDDDDSDDDDDGDELMSSFTTGQTESR